MARHWPSRETSFGRSSGTTGLALAAEVCPAFLSPSRLGNTCSLICLSITFMSICLFHCYLYSNIYYILLFLCFLIILNLFILCESVNLLYFYFFSRLQKLDKVFFFIPFIHKHSWPMFLFMKGRTVVLPDAATLHMCFQLTNAELDFSITKAYETSLLVLCIFSKTPAERICVMPWHVPLCSSSKDESF